MDESLFENFVCNLCLDPYTTPKSLPCLHCFCRECLLNYLQSRQPATVSSSSVLYYDTFPCPVCKQKVKLEWQQRLRYSSLGAVVDSFPDNFHIVNLMEQLDIKPLTKYCGMCNGDDIQSNAVSWCQDCNQALCQHCTETHKSLPVTAGHKLKVTGCMRGIMFANNSYPCPKHDTEPLKSYCHGCQICICYKCHLTDHKNCRKIILLEEAVADCSSEANVIIDDLKRQMETMVLLRDKITKQRNTAHDSRNSVVTVIQNTTSRLVEALKRNETNLVEEVDKFHKEEDNRMGLLENDVNDMLSNLSETYKIFENSCRGKNEPQFLNLINTIKKGIPDNEKGVEELSLRMDRKKRTFRFDMNAKVHECLQHLEGLPLGTVTISTDMFTEVGSDSEAIVTYSLPKMESSTSMDSIQTMESATETTLVDTGQEKGQQIKRRGLLSWLCRRGSPRVPQMTTSVAQGSKDSLIPDGVIFLSTGKSL